MYPVAMVAAQSGTATEEQTEDAMFESTSDSDRGRRLRLETAVGVVAALWVVYTIVYSSPLHDTLPGVFLELVPGALGVGVLLAAGFRWQDCYLRLGPLSRKGLLALIAVCPVLLGPLLSSQWSGFRPLPMLVYGPASGFVQELFFRATLLPALMRVFRRRPWPAILVHAVLFGLWHVPRALTTAPVAPVPATFAVAVATFLAGLGWGWQVQHDRTIVWTVAQHILFLMLMSLFGV
jgi:membrane protease YdiL (CAAX protease family)